MFVQHVAGGERWGGREIKHEVIYRGLLTLVAPRRGTALFVVRPKYVHDFFDSWIGLFVIHNVLAG